VVVVINHAIIHFNHHGNARDVQTRRLLWGPETARLLEHSHQHFAKGLFSPNRTVKLLGLVKEIEFKRELLNLFSSPYLLGDGSVVVRDPPGHRPRHIYPLYRISSENGSDFVAMRI